MQDERKTLDVCRSIIPCYSKQSPDLKVIELMQSSWTVHPPPNLSLLMGPVSLRQLFLGKRRYKLDIGGSLDADLPIPKRLVVKLGILSSTELYFWFPTRAVQKNFNVYTHLM